MGRATGLLVAGNAAGAAALVATLDVGLGAGRHHDVAYAALALATLAAWPLLRRRRLTTLLMASLGAWSLVTGLALVYVTPAYGHARWMQWWHGATSVGFTLAFFAHWARNRPRLGQLARAAWTSRPARLALAAAALATVVAVGASWATPARVLFDDAYVRELTLLSAVVVLGALVFAALAATSAALRERLARPAARNRLRGALDLALLASAWLALLTGLPLLYAARGLRALGAYWHVEGWHIVLSVALAGLVAAHATLNRRPLRAHLR